MSRSTTEIVYDVTGQTVAHRFMRGRPTSATFDVFADYAGDDATAEFSGSATVDSVSTTVDLACGASSADPQQVKLTATTNIEIGRKYLLAEDSVTEWVEPIEIVSADSIRVRHPLRNDYTTAATFVGTTLTAAIDATWVSNEANLSDQLDSNPSYRVRWEIVSSSATYVEYSFFDLVRATVTHQVDLSDLNDRAPGLADSCPTEYRVEQGRPLIETAWKSVRARLAAMGIDTDALRNDEITDELVILRSLNLLARGGWRPLGFDSLAEYIAATQQDYDRFIEQHFLVAQPHKMATGTTGAAEVVRQFVIGK
jgi:hypothetical protein